MSKTSSKKSSDFNQGGSRFTFIKIVPSKNDIIKVTPAITTLSKLPPQFLIYSLSERSG